MPGSGSAGPNLGLWWRWLAGESGWGLGGFNPNMAVLDALVGAGVLVLGQNSTPGSPGDGDRYIVGGSPSGTFTGHANALAVYRTTDTAWSFYAPKTGWRVYDVATKTLYVYNGTSWSPAYPVVNQAVTAAGANSAGATVLDSSDIHIVTSVSAGTGVRASKTGQIVINAGANPLLFYPKTGAAISSAGGVLGTDAGFSLIVGASGRLIEQSSTVAWMV
jgi:Protein of unknown function (DUF2793)